MNKDRVRMKQKPIIAEVSSYHQEVLPFLTYGAQSHKNIHFRIALLVAEHTPLNTILITTYRKKLAVEVEANFTYDIYNAHSDHFIVMKQTEHILASKYDLIMTFGPWCSRWMHDACQALHTFPPLIFTALTNRMHFGTPRDYSRDSKNITGVISTNIDYSYVVQKLVSGKPTMRGVLLLQRDSQFCQMDRLELSDVLRKNNIRVHTPLIARKQRISQVIRTYRNQIDTIIPMRDCSVLTYTHQIISAAQAYGITVCALDAGTLQAGAQVGLESNDILFSTHAAYLSKKILLEKQTPAQLPVIKLDASDRFVFGKTPYILRRKKKNIPRPVRVACIALANTQGFQDIICTVKKYLKKSYRGRIYIETFYSRHIYNPEKMTSIIDKALLRHCDLMYTCGTTALLQAQEALSQKKLRIPLVFTGVLKKISDTLLAPARIKPSEHSLITGVSCNEFNYHGLVTMLTTIKSDIRTILIPFAQSTNMQASAAAISALFKARNISCILLPAGDHNDLIEKFARLLPHYSINTIITLWDCLGRNATPQLAALCNQTDITLCTLHYAGINQGAALSYAIQEQGFATQSAEQILRIISDQKHPVTIPSQVIKQNYCLYVNKSSARYQGINLEDKNLNQLSNIVIV